MPSVRTTWSAADPTADGRERARDDVVAEAPSGDGTFIAVSGPFSHYRRTLRRDTDTVTEDIDFRLAIPWFGWLAALPARRALRRPRRDGRQPWWAPPDRLDARGGTILGLCAAASLIVGYVNTLFTQTVAFAADEFGSSDTAQAVAGVVVRLGIVFSVVLVFLADHRGRRTMLVIAAFAAPLICATGALAPSLPVLTATQTLGRPTGIALGLLIGIMLVEEMPRNSRAYGVSVLSMASGLGAGFCLFALPLADLGVRAWRLVYVVPIVFVVIALDLWRRLPESRRFVAPHAVAPAMPSRRLALLAGSAFLANILVAPASFFTNRYLKDVRNYAAWKISLFTLSTNTPGGIGIVVGGRLADLRGRRIVGAVGIVGGTVFTVLQFAVGGAPMWFASVAGAILGGAAIPALGVYGAELFPTGNRGRASGIIAVLSLVGSSVGLLAAGLLLDADAGFGSVMALLAVGPLIVVFLVLLFYPETAHHELEDLNPVDRVIAGSGVDGEGGAQEAVVGEAPRGPQKAEGANVLEPGGER